MSEVEVVLAPSFQTVEYDEVAVWNRTLSAAEIAGMFAAAARAPWDDPEATAGWEEVYGTDYPFTENRVPAMSNGLCRVSWDTTRNVFVLYAHDHGRDPEGYAGVGYVEMGRVGIWAKQTAGSSQRLGVVRGVTLYEWTPERGVVRAVVDTYDTGDPLRADVFVTLQRGWTGPRIEVYGAPYGGAAVSCYVRYSPYRTDDVALVNQLGVVRVSNDAGWDNVAFSDFAAAFNQPWLALMGAQKTVVVTVMRTGEKARTFDDTTAYGTERAAVAVGVDHGTAVAGYTSAKFGFVDGTSTSPVVGLAEAERWMNTGGTRSQVADGTASAGLAVEDTQTSAAAATLRVAQAQLVGVPLGLFAVYARVRVVTGGATVSVKAAVTGTGANDSGTAATSTSTAFAWVYVGEVTHANADNVFDLTIWRSAGSGNVRVDRFAVVVKTQTERLGMGVADEGLSQLYETRSVPELVTR